MYKYIIVFCVCSSLTSVICKYLYKLEGDDCEWEGLMGKCVPEKRCLTTIDDESPKHPVCDKKSRNKIICCTDCDLVNNTDYAIFISSGLFWMNNQKARDTCLQYIQDLPYKCKEDDFLAGVRRAFDEDHKCYSYEQWESGSDSTNNQEHIPEFPYHALLGYGEDLESARWPAGGSIVSDKYILTSAHYNVMYNGIKFIALGVKKLSDSPTAWQTHTVKRFIPHPEFQLHSVHNDIGLIETENTITFNRNVLPACLHFEAADDESAIITTWRNQETESYYTFVADTIQPINLNKLSEEECKTAYVLPKSLEMEVEFNSDTQMCYGSNSGSTEACKGLTGEPLVISSQFSSCVYNVIGILSFGRICENLEKPYGVYTRVAPYIPWIESVVWP